MKSKKIKYQPKVKCVVDRFLVVRAQQASPAKLKLGPPSVHRFDSRILTEIEWDSAAQDMNINALIEYESQLLPVIHQGNKYLLAISDDICISILPISDDNLVLLPGASSQTLNTFINDQLMKPFPDFYGFRE